MIGWSVKQLLSAFAQLSPAVSTIALTSYQPAPILSERLSRDASLEASAQRFVREALRHRGYANPVEDCRIELLGSNLSELPRAGTVRGICSRVRLRDGVEAQIPLLDFQCPVTNDNTAALLEAAREMGQRRGALIASGRSYHYYGFDPLTPLAWRQLMTCSILLTPLIDVRYLAHCMIEDLACLRIDARPQQTTEPVVLATLD